MFKKIISLGCLLSLVPTAATAGAVPQTGYYATTSQGVKINYALPSDCDGNIVGAVNTVNALGVRFQLTGAGQNYTDVQYDAYSDAGFVNIQDRAGLGSLMTTSLWTNGATSGPKQHFDSTVYVNADRLYYGDREASALSNDLVCGNAVSSSNIGQRQDFQSAMVHEFGHVMGMGHRSDGSTGPCLMTTYLSNGQIKRSFCSDERSLMLGFYGAR